MERKRILFCVLNWGLGHATRSVPIIRHLLQSDVDILLASDGRALQLLRHEFPTLPYSELVSYNISYPNKNINAHLALRIPQIIATIRKEKNQINKLVTNWNPQAIISDNRYGCYVKTIPSVFLCHQTQLFPQSWFGFRYIANVAHNFFKRKFDQIWIPDQPVSPGLGGNLSHNGTNDRSRYIGALSRLRATQQTIKYDYLAVLSGPEPQRSYLEMHIISQAKNIQGAWLIVGGKTEAHSIRKMGSNINYVSFMGTSELEKAYAQSRFVICRSGYTSLMDLHILGKPALLIPTPGQQEQLYLASLHVHSDQFAIVDQEGLDLKSALLKLENKKGKPDSSGQNLMETVVGDLLASMEKQSRM